MDTISLIIPVYNMEVHLRRCLESIIDQTYKNIEIILINDGSKDNTLKICKEYLALDKRIKVIDKVNEGVSVARNYGLEAATGDYIGFIDPDDWIEPNMYESMLETIKSNNCNIAFCNYYKDNKFNSSQKTFKFKKDVLGKLDIIDELIGNMIGIEDILPRYYNVMGCVWRCLYKREFIEKYQLRFKPGITIMEDLIFTIEALIYCDKVCIDHNVLYHYMQNKTSSLHKYNKKMWLDQMAVHETLEGMLKDADLDEYMRNRLDSRYIAMAACAIGNEMYRSNAKMKKKMELVKYIVKDEKLKVVLERAKNYNIENLKDLKNKDEALKETKIIKNLQTFINTSKEEIQ